MPVVFQQILQFECLRRKEIKNYNGFPKILNVIFGRKKFWRTFLQTLNDDRSK